MKKALPVLVVLALIAAVGLGFFMGQRSNEPTIENPPAQSTPEADTEKSPTLDTESETIEYLQGDELIAYFQQIYDLVIEQEIPQEYRLQTELLYLSEMNTSGKELPADYEEQYLAWRPVDEAAEPETSAPIENDPVVQQPTQQPSNPPANNPGNSGGISGGNSSVDANGDGFPDSWQMEEPGNGSSDLTDKDIEGGSNTDHGYSGITIH